MSLKIYEIIRIFIMKQGNILSALMFTVLLIFALSCNVVGSKDWVVKIDDDVITVEEFENYYYTQNKLALNIESKEEIDKLAEDPAFLNPQVQQSVVKASFLDNLIAMKLLYAKAMEDKEINRTELDIVIDITVMQMVGQYYMSKKFKSEIEVTDEEVDRFYKENRELFKGVPMSDSVINRIKQQIFMQKSTEKSKEYVMTLLAEHKVNREGFKKYLQAASKKEEVKDEVKTDEKAEEKTKK